MKTVMLLLSMSTFIVLALALVVTLVRDYVLHRTNIDHSSFSKAVSDKIVNSITTAKAWFYAFTSGLQRSPTLS